jgi:hypothetical protein
MKASYLLFLITASIILVTNGYKILGVFPFGSASHYAIGEATLKALAEAGHEVTMISVLETKKKLKNYREIIVPDSVKKFLKGLRKKQLNYKPSVYNFYILRSKHQRIQDREVNAFITQRTSDLRIQ